MGYDVPRDPLAYDVFRTKGWDFAWAFAGEDFSDVTAVRLGLKRRGLPAAAFELTLADGDLSLDFVPDDGAEAVGNEAPNGVVVNRAPSDADEWIVGNYDFQIALTRGDGSIDIVLEGVITVREAS